MIASKGGNSLMKLRGGNLQKNIEIEAGEVDYVEIACREGSRIVILAREVDGDNFDAFLLPSKYVKTLPLVGTVVDYNPDGVVWYEDAVNLIDDDYIVLDRDTMYLFFSNINARTKYRSIDIDIGVEHIPLEVGDEPLRESFEVDAGYVETIDMSVHKGDTVRAFGRVTKGNDITVHILSKIYETPDSLHLDKAYFTREKVGEVDITFNCPKTEQLLLVFDNEYSLRTTKTVDVSIQLLKGETQTGAGQRICKFCSARIDYDVAFCPHCGGKQ
jgi:hypothetical protein